jgi:hypothetical protein
MTSLAAGLRVVGNITLGCSDELFFTVPVFGLGSSQFDYVYGPAS